MAVVPQRRDGTENFTNESKSKRQAALPQTQLMYLKSQMGLWMYVNNSSEGKRKLNTEIQSLNVGMRIRKQESLAWAWRIFS